MQNVVGPTLVAMATTFGRGAEKYLVAYWLAIDVSLLLADYE